MNKCPICGDFRFSMLNKSSMNGHLSHCLKQKRNEEINYIDLNSNLEQLDDTYLDLNDALPIINDLSVKFLKKQNLCLSQWGINHINIGHIALLNGERKMGNLRTYLLISKFVTHCFGVSREDAGDLVQLIKLVSHINGKEIPIPAKYITIENRLLSSLDFLKISLELFQLEMPASLFTETIIKQIPKAEGIISNIIEVAGKQHFK